MNPKPNNLVSSEKLLKDAPSTNSSQEAAQEHEQVYQAALKVLNQDALVVANAGCGKTHLMVEHYFYLLAQGLDPQQVVAFTFTEKAALELRERILRRLPQHPDFCQLSTPLMQAWQRKLEKALIGTIHQFCFRLLQQSALFQETTLQILSEATESHWLEQSMRECVQEMAAPLESFQAEAQAFHRLLQHFGMKRLLQLLREYGQAAQTFSHSVNLELPEALPLEATLLKDVKKMWERIAEKLQQKKTKQANMSFADLEFQALENLKHPEPALQNFLRPIRYYLVDEFQDTSPLQIELLEKLRRLSGFAQSSSESRETLAKTRSQSYLFCVGDPKQSIYRFRQVDQKVIEEASQRILERGGAQFDLTRNYRTVGQLLDFQNQFIHQSFTNSLPSQATREPSSTSSQEPSVALVSLSDPEKKLKAEDYRIREAHWIAQKILQLQSQGQALGEMAVLYRAAASSLPLLTALKSQGLPFTVRGGQHLLDLQAIRDCHHLLKWLTFPEDDVALLGVLRSPLFLLSDKTLYELCLGKPKEKSLWEHLHHSLFQNPKEGKTSSEENTQETTKVHWALKTLIRMGQDRQEMSPAVFLRAWNQTLGITALYGAIHEEFNTPLALEQFFHELEQMEVQVGVQVWEETCQLLKNIQSQDHPWAPLGDRLSHPDSIQILTIHAAKGLEFKNVFLGDLNRAPQHPQSLIQQAGESWALKLCSSEGRLQNTARFDEIKAYHEAENHLENKRLLYVALTRAADHLWIPLDGSTRKKSLQALLMEALPDQGKNYFIPKDVKVEPEGAAQEIKQSFLAKENKNQSIEVKPHFSRKNFLDRHQETTRTVSELESFVSCPLKHHYLYELKISEQDWAQQPLPKQATEIGTLLHEALHAHHRFPQKSRGQILQDLLLEKQLWLQEASLGKLEETLSLYQESPLYEKILQAKQDYSELAFLLQLPNGQVRGQIDRLVESNGQWTLIDFKYSQKSKGEKALLAQYGFQLKTYALAARRFLKGELPQVEIHLLAQLKSYRFSFSEQELEAHQQQLEQTLQEIQQAPLDQVTQSPACHTCHFRETIPLCPVFKE